MVARVGLLANRVIAITGSSSGIGRATALGFAKQGARLVLHHVGDDKSTKDMVSLQAEINSLSAGLKNDTGGQGPKHVAVGLDVTSEATGQNIVEAAVGAFGEINGIVHNAGICQFADFHAITASQVSRHMNINFAGPFHITQAVTQQMIKQKTGGSVIFIASITATMGSKQLTHYASSKAALLGMTASCAVALGTHNIRFNAVSPGTIETDMNKADLQGPKRSIMEGRVPLARLGRPSDLIGPILFFASDMSEYVTGQNLIIDGGASINYQ